MSDGTPFLRVAADRIGAPGSPAKMPFRATNAANWSSIIRIGAKMAVIRRRTARRAVSSHTQRAGRVPYGESRLNTQARRILERQPRGPSSFVFPSPRDLARPRGPNLPLWYPVRREAGIEDVRLHDLRHTHASHAIMNGVPVPVVSRLLGHSNVSMTLRYAHLGDRDVEAAAERVGQSIGAIMGI